MRSTSIAIIATIATLFEGTVAVWNPKICNGAGGCLGITWWPGTDFDCANGKNVTAQQVASNTLAMDAGSYDVITADKFPKTCLRNVVPSAKSILTVRVTDTHKFYQFIDETCRETKPEADCYNQNPNPSGNTICQITTLSGDNCWQGKPFG